MKHQRWQRLAVKIADLYYQQNMSQQEISHSTGISRTQISRILSRAREEGIVRITIHNPYSREDELQRQLIQTYGLKEACVVDTGLTEGTERLGLLAEEAAAFLEDKIKDHFLIGVMSGYSVYQLAEHAAFQQKDLEFLPLVGGWAKGYEWNGNGNARIFAEKSKAVSYVLNAPFYASSEQAKEVFVEEPGIRVIIDRFSKCDMVIAGIGNIDGIADLHESTMTKREIQQLKEAGAKASLFTDFIDEHGNILDIPVTRQIIGCSCRNLSTQSERVAIAAGEHKLEAISIALKTGRISTFITDIATAQQLLSL